MSSESGIRHISLLEVEGDEKGESSQVADDKNVWADEVRFTGDVRVGPWGFSVNRENVVASVIGSSASWKTWKPPSAMSKLIHGYAMLQGGLDEEEDDSFWASTHGKGPGPQDPRASDAEHSE